MCEKCEKYCSDEKISQLKETAGIRGVLLPDRPSSGSHGLMWVFSSYSVCGEFLSSSSFMLDLFTFPVAYLETGHVQNC